jgi:hypothetical protein
VANLRIDSLLTSGPIPPGPAFDIAIAVASRLAGAGNVGSIMLRADRVQVSTDGSVTLVGQRMPGASAEGDAYALGALLAHMIVGAPYSKEQHGASLREINSALELWPGGKDAIATVEWLLAIDPKTPAGITTGAVEKRLQAARAKLGGSALVAWLKNLHGTPAPGSEFGMDPSNPELATGMIPVGALAKLVNQGAPPASEPPPGPPSAPDAGLDQLSKQAAGGSEAPTPVPVSGEARRLSSSSATLLVSGAVLWGLTVILLLVALVLVAYLLS